MNELWPHLSNGVVELSGTDDHLHLKDVPFGHAPLNKTLQHLLLIQPDMSEEKQQGCEKTQPHCTHSDAYFPNTHTTYLKLPVRSEAPGLSNTWVKKFAPRLWMREGNRGKKRKSNLSLLPAKIRVWVETEDCCWLVVTWWVSCADPSRTRLHSHGSEYQTPGRNHLPSAFWQTRQNSLKD